MADDPLAAYLNAKTSPPAPGPAPARDPLADYVQARTPEAPPGPAPPTGLESFFRSVAQGATAGFADEVTAGFEKVMRGRDYGEALAETRGKYKAAKEANPKISFFGELAGGVATALIPGTQIVKGAGLAANIARGAGAGIASGIGHSEATDVADIAKDAAVGGLTGGAVGGALGRASGKLLHGADERVARRITSDIGDRAPKGVRDRIADKADDVRALAEKHGLVDDVARDAKTLSERTAPIVSKTGAGIGKVYKAVDQVRPDGIPVDRLLESIGAVQKKYLGNGATRAEAKAVGDAFDDIVETYGERVTSEQLHDYVSKLGRKAFGGATVSPGSQKEIQREIAGAAKDVLRAHLKEVASDAPEDVSQAIRGLGKLNREYGAAKEIEKAAKHRAKLDEFKPTGLRSFTVRGALEQGYEATAGKLARPLDRAIVQLTKDARAGLRGPQLLERAAELGVPRTTAEKLGAMFATDEDNAELF